MAGLESGVATRQLRALFWNRGKLAMRLFTREKGRIIGAIITLLFVGPLVLGASIGTAFGYRLLPDHWPMQLLGGVFVIMWAIWLFAPIILSGVNEGADISRLLIYPVSRRTLLGSIVLGTVFDYTTYLMLPLFVAILIGFPRQWAVVLLALLIAYGHLFVIGQLSQTLLVGLVQSRRFRDFGILIGALFGSTCYMWQLGFQRWIENASLTDGERLLSLRPLDTFQWFPTGALAKTIEQAQFGDWGNVALWLGYSIVWLVGLTAVWWILLERMTTGQTFMLAKASKEEKQKKVSRQRAFNLLNWLPADIAQLFVKELKSIWRLPQRRVGLIQGVFFPFIMMGAFLFTGDSSSEVPPWMGYFIPFYAFFMFWTNSMNMLGWEGYGLATLLLTPTPRQRIFVAKGMALMVVVGTPFLIISVLLANYVRSWQAYTGILTGITMGMTTIGVSAVASVLFPMRVKLEGKQTQQSLLQTGGGCLTGIASVFLVPLIIWIVAIPAALPMAVAGFMERPLIATIGSVIVPAYGLFIAWGGTRLAGNLLTEREAEVFATLKQPEFGE